VALKERISEMEQEKDQVTSRIAVTKGKVASKAVAYTRSLQSSTWGPSGTHRSR